MQDKGHNSESYSIGVMPLNILSRMISIGTACGALVIKLFLKGSNGLMDKVSVSQSRDCGFEPHTGHDHDSSYDTSTGWFQEADSRVINISC